MKPLVQVLVRARLRVYPSDKPLRFFEDATGQLRLFVFSAFTAQSIAPPRQAFPDLCAFIICLWAYMRF